MGRKETHLSTYNILVVIFVALGSVTYGFCASIIATTLGQPTFISYFNLDDAGYSAQIMGAIQGLFQAGGLFGALSIGFLADRYGRRKTIFLGSLLAVIGGGLQAGSVHIAMFLVARLISGIGIGNLVIIVPLWQSEVSSPATRGLLVGFHGVFILCGYSFANWVGVGFFHVQASGAQWRIPLAIQCLTPLILLGGVMRLPESPRWLIQQKDTTTALQILGKLHGTGTTEDGSSYGKLEFDSIVAQLAHDQSLPSSWKTIFTTKSYRKRAIIGFLTMFLGQGTGTMIINNYGPSIYAGMGYDTSMQLILTALWTTIGIFLNALSAVLMDRVGRVKLMIIGYIGCAFVLMMMAIMLSQYQGTTNSAGLSAAVFFIFLHIGVYGVCIDGVTYVYCTEIWPMHIRAKGSALAATGLFTSSVIILSISPTVFNSISWRYYFVFMSICIIATAATRYWWPETKGVALEDIGRLFNDTVFETLTASELEIDGVATKQEMTEKTSL
ncbi:hypothetical protein N7465_002518 [Penicillium sp. CMV-2018d]|nr:hypothetical protein N7465_002518 [Penicillium sp. CMV-2018d]